MAKSEPRLGSVIVTMEQSLLDYFSHGIYTLHIISLKPCIEKKSNPQPFTVSLDFI